jgi:hypothetical protein
MFRFGALFPPWFRWTLMRMSSGASPTLTNFHKADMISAVAILISLVVRPFLRETGSARHPPVAKLQPGE